MIYSFLRDVKKIAIKWKRGRGKGGRMEEGKRGRVEGWKRERGEGWNGRVEEGKGGRGEGWRDGRGEERKVGGVEGLSLIMSESRMTRIA